MSSEYRSMRAELPAQVVELVDAETAARMVRPYAWFLARVGTEGIKLTRAGYLPAPDVEAAVAELGLAEEWYGKFNRESHTLPVLHLRESAMYLGLLRKCTSPPTPSTQPETAPHSPAPPS